MRLRLLAPLLLPLACTTVERAGPRLAVEEVSRDCDDTHAHAVLERAEHQQLRAKLVVDSSCKVKERDTVTTERYGRSYALPAALAALVAVVVAVPCAIGAGMLATATSDASSARGTGQALGVLPGVAAGIATAIGVPPTEVQLEDAAPKQVERDSVVEGKRAPSGLLHVKGDDARLWTLDDGKALIPVKDAVAVPMDQLTFEGLPLELDAPSVALVKGLGHCRKALEGFKPTEAPKCPDAAVRLEEAVWCRKAGWDAALPVEAKFGAVRCAAQAPDAGVGAADAGTAAPAPSGPTPPVPASTPPVPSSRPPVPKSGAGTPAIPSGPH